MILLGFNASKSSKVKFNRRFFHWQWYPKELTENSSRNLNFGLNSVTYSLTAIFEHLVRSGPFMKLVPRRGWGEGGGGSKLKNTSKTSQKIHAVSFSTLHLDTYFLNTWFQNFNLEIIFSQLKIRN